VLDGRSAWGVYPIEPVGSLRRQQAPDEGQQLLGANRFAGDAQRRVARQLLDGVGSVAGDEDGFQGRLQRFADGGDDLGAGLAVLQVVVGHQQVKPFRGVSRYAEYLSDGAGELAITIADAWQHKGLDQLLLRQLITYAKTHGMKQLYSVELADNIAMRELASEFGMSVGRDPDDAGQVIYSLTL
jgi:L-amino acid N-acyltransferase YncA